MTITEDASFNRIYKEHTDDKIVLMIYTTSSCPQCAYMKQKVFKENKVNAFMRKHFVILEKNIHKDNLPDGFEYFGIPTMFFINSNGVNIEKVVGSSRAEPFLKQLKQIVKKAQNR